MQQSTKATPNIKEVLQILLTGKPLHHHDWIAEHDSQEHRLSETISRLRHRCGFKGLIQCPRGKTHPLANHYFIANSDLQPARKLAELHGLIIQD